MAIKTYQIPGGPSVSVPDGGNVWQLPGSVSFSSETASAPGPSIPTLSGTTLTSLTATTAVPQVTLTF